MRISWMSGAVPLMRRVLRRGVLRALIVIAPLAVAAAPDAYGQELERPVAFDTAGRVMTITTALAARLGLSAPTWPVTGTYVEARLFDRADGTFVINALRPDGSVSRYTIAADARTELGRRITSGMASTGQFSTGERADVTSESASGHFVRSQTIASLYLYAPAVATLGSGGTAGGLYLLTVGATYFVTSAFAKTHTITRAQNHLASDGVWRGALLASGMRYVLAPKKRSDNGNLPIARDASDDNTDAVIAFGGALAGTIAGYHGGRSLSDGEASGAILGSTMSAAFTAGGLGIANAHGGEDGRWQVGMLIGASLVGYPLGLRYVRHAGYNVTSGDVGALGTSALLGVVAASTFIADDNVSGSLASAVLTAGLFGGLVIGDRVLVRPYDFTENENWRLRLGALAGGVMGIAIPLLFESDNPRFYLGSGSLGAIAGMAITKNLLAPRKAGR